MGRLDTRSSEILIYHHIDGMTREEVATLTRLSRRTVGTRLAQIKATITLVRERAGSIVTNPDGYRDGDRFSIRVTCPAGETDITVAITQQGETYSPYPPQRIQCGNQVPLPGAFTVTGPGDVQVCAAVDGEQVCAAVSASH